MASAGTRRLLVVVAIAAAQAAALLLYSSLEQGRGPQLDDDLSFEALNAPLPALALERPGETAPASERRGTWVLHLWATWCRPCRDELPGLLTVARESPVPLVLASTDESWAVIEHYLEENLRGEDPLVGRSPDGALPEPVWRLPTGTRGLPARTLPTTLVVRDGRVVARLEGARRWTSSGLRGLLDEVSREGAPEAESARGGAPAR